MNSFTIIKEQAAPSIRAAQALPEDAPAISELLVQTARWLQSKGSTQWHELLEGQDKHNMTGAVLRGDVFAFRDGDTVAGTVMLLREPSAWDIELWGESGHEGAVYLHRLAINRAYGGTGLGQAILQWAETGISFPGADRARLDCIAHNGRLNELYSGAGYAFMGQSANGFNKYEKRI